MHEKYSDLTLSLNMIIIMIVMSMLVQQRNITRILPMGTITA